jgi:Putative prokaryotic signal transducing protein
MFCPKCRAEYKEGVVECYDCGVPLVPELPEKRQTKDVDFVSVVQTFNPQDVAIIESLLEESGIEYYIQGATSITTNPLIDPAHVMVVKAQADEARELLKDLDLKFYFFKADKDENGEKENDSLE